MSSSRRFRTMVLAAVLLGPISALGAPEGDRTSSLGLYLRGLPTLRHVVDRVALDLEVRQRESGGPALLVLLVEHTPAPMAHGAVALTALPDLFAKLGPDARVALVATGGGGEPEPTGDLRELAERLADLRATMSGAAPNVLADLRRVAHAYSGWKGPRDVLLLANLGAPIEENLEGTIRDLGRSGFRVSVVAGEAAHSRPWTDAPAVPPGFQLRAIGARADGGTTVYAGGDSAFRETPDLFDADLADTTFRIFLGRFAATKVPIPSGFGYYHLARLCQETGGRYFTFTYVKSPARTVPIQLNYGLLRLMEPDLRSRTEITRSIAADPLARAVYRAWSRLADRGTGVIRREVPFDIGRMVPQDEVPVAPTRPLRFGFLGKGDAFAMNGLVKQRLREVEACLREVDDAIAKYRVANGGGVAAGDGRWLAEAELMKLQLLRARFHLGEMDEGVKSLLDVDYRNKTIRLVPRLLFRGARPVPGAELPTALSQVGALHETIGHTEAMAERYEGTPWAYWASLGELHRYVVVMNDKGDSRPVAKSGDDDKGGKSDDKKSPTDEKPKPPSPPPPKPNPGQPGSTSGGPATGGD